VRDERRWGHAAECRIPVPVDHLQPGLRSVLAGDPVPPANRGIARHEELVHEFGLDQPEVAESGGRWTVRVERQVTCPAEVAWDLWFGKDRDTLTVTGSDPGERDAAAEMGYRRDRAPRRLGRRVGAGAAGGRPIAENDTDQGG
jgi:hypothetical protein